MQAGASSSSTSYLSSSFPPSSSSRYDIFLSFRGEDTRKNFTSHLFAALKHQGYNVFHDTLLPRGQEVSSQLLKAIEESKLSIVVFSEKYADSRWCMDELVKIMDCRRCSQQIVLPVFLGAEPSNVRNQTGSYSTPVTNDLFGQGDKWRAALKEAGNLSGLHLQNDSNGDEADFITKIVNEVVEKLDQPYLNVADYPVGIESHVQKLKSLLSLGTDDVQIVAIWGVGGLGKTTIAKALFNKIYRSFEGSCFLADVGTVAMQTLQERLISSVLKENMPKIDDCHRGIEVIKQKVWCRKVLLVLDDVNNINQLENLAINGSYGLPKGSKIIITTRDSFCVSSVDAKLYEPRPLSEKDSLSLFKWHAFGVEYPNQVYEELSMKVVDYAGGLPLVLKTLGSYMRILRTTEEWQEALERLRVIPPDDIQAKLKMSFDSLRGREKELFLDIACFFIGMDKDFVCQVLDEKAPEHYPKPEVKVLCNRCLVKTDSGKLSMHDMVRDMGRGIVHQESLNPERRSRLWHPNDVFLVLKESLGTEAVESIILEAEYRDNEAVDVNALTKMSKLRMIQFRHLKLHGTFDGTQSLDNLIWLSWYMFPLTCIPTNLDMRNLVALNLQNSNLRQLWKGPKVFKKLRFLDVSDSYFLTSTPDFSGVINLEKLRLRNCTNLVEIHQTIRNLDKLVVLDLQNCKRLIKIPSGILRLKSLKDANLSGCSRLSEEPCGVCHLLCPLLLWKSMPKTRESAFLLTSSEQGQSYLKELRLENCDLINVPIEIESNSTNMPIENEKLVLGAFRLIEIGNLVSLEELYLSGNIISSLPASIGDLHRLQVLEVKDCFLLKTIEDLPTNDFLLVRAEGSLSLETVQIKSERFTEAQIFVSNGTKLLDNIFANKEHGHPLSKIRVVVSTDDILHWFNYQGKGPFISFVAPKKDGRSIRGFVVGVSAGACLRFFVHMLVYVYNKTKEKMHTVFVGLSSANHLLISYIHFSKYGIVVDGGDEIEILFLETGGQVEKCGLHLVNDGDEDLEVDEHFVIQHSSRADEYMNNMMKAVLDFQAGNNLLANLCVPDFLHALTTLLANLGVPDFLHALTNNSGVDFIEKFIEDKLEPILESIEKDVVLWTVDEFKTFLGCVIHSSRGDEYMNNMIKAVLDFQAGNTLLANLGVPDFIHALTTLLANLGVPDFPRALTTLLVNLGVPDFLHSLINNSEVDFIEKFMGYMFAPILERIKKDPVLWPASEFKTSLRRIMLPFDRGMKSAEEFFKPQILGFLRELRMACRDKDAILQVVKFHPEKLINRTKGSLLSAYKEFVVNVHDREFRYGPWDGDQALLEKDWDSVARYFLHVFQFISETIESMLERSLMDFSTVLLGLAEVVARTDMKMMESYVSLVMMASVKPVLQDLCFFDEMALLELLQDLGGGRAGIRKINNEHRPAYLLIANEVYANYMKSSTSNPSGFLEMMEKSINQPAFR